MKGADNLVGDALGVAARTVEGDLIGDSGRRKGDARGELKDMGLVGDCDCRGGEVRLLVDDQVWPWAKNVPL